MSNYNLVVLMGRLTRDPEVRYSPKGTAIAKIGIAINRHWRTEAGEKKEETVFVDVDCFGKQAETIAQYMKKGSNIHATGRLKLDQWEDKKTNEKRSKLGVIMESFQFLGDGGKSESKPSEDKPKSPIDSEDVPSNAPADDDVPF